MATTIMTNWTCGNGDLERAILPFIVGNVAVSADQPAIVLLTIEGVWLATKGYDENRTIRDAIGVSLVGALVLTSFSPSRALTVSSSAASAEGTMGRWDSTS